MAQQPTRAITKIAIRVAAAGLGAAVAGRLGCALGAAFGDALSGPLGEMVGKLVEEGGKETAKKLFDTGGDALAEKIKGSGGNLDAVYREALRLSLAAMRSQIGSYEDWFRNWDRCLKARDALRLDELRADQLDQLTFAEMDAVLRQTLVRLDAQGAMMGQKTASIALLERVMPRDLDTVLAQSTPRLFDENFRALIVSEEYEEAWKEAQLGFQEFASSYLVSIKADTEAIKTDNEAIKTDTSAIVSGVTLSNEKLDRMYALMVRRAEEDERIGSVEARALKAEGESEEWKRKYLALVKANPPLEALLETGDLDAAALQKTEQLKIQSREHAKTYIELGRIHELRFDWKKALDAYRQAWKLEPNWTNGFKYAYLAQKQNRHKEAITVYEAIRLFSENPESAALALNNVAILYSATQRMRDADLAYREALSIYRQRAKENPEAHLPDVAMTLNNLAIVYHDTQRMRDAELAYDEALSIYRQLAKDNPEAYLPDVARTVSNLANLYRAAQRMRDAEMAFDEALSIYRQLAKENAEAYLPDVARTLNNLAILYHDTQRLRDAELSYDEALSLYRQLTNENPETHLPGVAKTLNNLGNLYGDTQRMRNAEQAYDESFAIRRQLAKENADAYLPDVARTLNNLALLYCKTQRMRDAEQAYDESLAMRRQMAKENPEAYLPDVAMTLNNCALLYRHTNRGDEALRVCREAESILRPIWQRNPAVHGDLMARILWTRADLAGEGANSTDDACRLAREALGMAYDPTIKARIQKSIGRWCGDAEG